VILGVLILIFSNISDRNKPSAMNYSEFVTAVNAGQIKQVTIDGLNIMVKKQTVLILKVFVRRFKTPSLCQA
jgi:cell division protease FtsH